MPGRSLGFIEIHNPLLVPLEALLVEQSIHAHGFAHQVEVIPYLPVNRDRLVTIRKGYFGWLLSATAAKYQAQQDDRESDLHQCASGPREPSEKTPARFLHQAGPLPPDI